LSAAPVVIDASSGGDLRSSRVLSALRVCAFLVVAGAVSSPPLANVAAALCVIFCALLPDRKARLRLLADQPMLRALAVLGLVLAAATLHTVLLGGGWRVAADGLWGWRHLLLIPIMAAAFAEVAPRRRFIMAFVVLGALGAAAIMLAAALGWSKDPPEVPPGLLFRNTVTQALFLALAGFLALLAAASALTGSRREKLVLLVCGIGVVGVLVVYQTGRSGFIALIVMVAVAGLLRFRGITGLAVLLGVLGLAAAAVAYSPVQKQRFNIAVQELIQRDKTAATTSMGLRTLIWHDTALMIRERPLLGWGLGRYKDAHAAIIARGPAVAAMSHPSTDPHNQFLRLWVEAGLPGLIAFLAVLWGAWRQRGPRLYAVAGLSILAAWCVNSLFSSHFWVFNEGHLIAVFMGVLLARAPATGTAPGTQASAASVAASTAS
jgi:O-antigen ligase